MTSKPIVACLRNEINGADGRGLVMQISTSHDLLNWSKPEIVCMNGVPWGNHYNAIVPNDKISQPNVLTENTFSILNNHNGTDVVRYQAEIKRRLV
jgi:hypothetical protein